MSLRTHASRARRWTNRKRSPRYGEAVFLGKQMLVFVLFLILCQNCSKI